MGLMKAVQAQQLYIVHGSTVATNAALERKGARTLFITNKGFKDLLTIGRQARKELYNLKPQAPIPPVPASDCLEVDTRRDANGDIVKALSDQDLAKLEQRVLTLNPEAIAINLLFSYLSDEEERKIESLFKETYFTSRSSFVLPKYKEYERGMATWLNASLGPKVNQYMESLMRGLNACPVSIMQSSGGTLAIDQAAQRAVNLLLSGPAGGLSAIREISQCCDIDKIISFDMGGTSTDVALMDGEFSLTDEGQIGDWPVAIPMLEMETIGAGGGSIAWTDPAGLMHVGPQSAGSLPGPACYGKGGQQATVTDANLFLGRLRADAFLGGRMSLFPELAEAALGELSKVLQLDITETALGVIRLAEHHMIQALQKISIKKGYNPEEFVLCCFGGAGGLHVCSLAEQLNMSDAIIPANSGVLSALGMLTAPIKRQVSKTHITTWKDEGSRQLEEQFVEIEEEAIASIKAELPEGEQVQVKRSLDMRYQGQSYTLNLPFQEDMAERFKEKHEQLYGHGLDLPVEQVNLCVEVNVASRIQLSAIENEQNTIANQLPTTGDAGENGPIYDRAKLPVGALITGPALITEEVSTTWLRPGWTARIDAFGHLRLHHGT